jgi:peptidoglycan L-alanyl-D-glutamate endopeptidase CwlK
MRKWGARSLKNLTGIHPDLRRVMDRALQESPIDFTVIEGLRTLARQRQLVAKGASQTLNSRHLTGHAVDIMPLVNGVLRWDWPLYHRIAPAVKLAAQTEGVPIEWGGGWRSFPDGPHWQLPWGEYPA